MRYKLTSTDGGQSFELREGPPLLVGRAPSSDIPVVDPTISRRHAEVTADSNGVQVRDLGSSNGTFVNGTRVERTALVEGDVVTFGKVAFRLQLVGQKRTRSSGVDARTPTIVRQIAVRESSPLLDTDRSRQKLATLLEISKSLGRATDIDALLMRIVEYAYEILDVDRVAILLEEATGELGVRIARDRRGGDSARAVPQSIARKAVRDKVAILSDNAGEDTRFGGQSIVMQQIRSTICCPLVGSEERVLGVLYVDNVTTHQFSEEDLELCIAFAGIAAVAIENSQFAQRIQRDLLTRSNFERFFAPQLAKRIAESAETIRPGGEKRNVAVLFSDIRGFTPLSETMRPDDMANLLTEYFTEMVECVFRHDGTLDKFMGDAVMAQWGAPISTTEDADRAMRAAIDMLRELDSLNSRWRASGRPELKVGIGLNFGEAFAGTIGSDRRLEFTVIGDTVNTAARLCAVAGPGEILLTQEMRDALHSPPRMVECPPMELKGKRRSIPVYRVVID